MNDQATGTEHPVDSRLADVDSMPIEQAVHAIIEHAVNLGASDLFFLAQGDYMAVQMRHLGIVRPITIVGAKRGSRFVQHIKANSGMDVAERRRPIDGRWIYHSTDEEGVTVDLRINSIPTVAGEDVAIRLLAREKGLFGLDDLGMTEQQLAQFRKMLSDPSGLILCTGPSGCGKTATLYAALQHLYDGSRKINTIEDPVEYSLEGIRQSQVNQRITGAGFADLLRGVLRQAPDVIMIGEIRDSETARTAVRAANSGHLVLSTLHAPVAVGAVQAMRSFGIPAHFLATSLSGIVAQRLVRTFCSECQQEFELDTAPEVFKQVRHLLGEGEGQTIGSVRGCEACGYTGYVRRRGVFEILEVDRRIRNMISKGDATEKIRRQAVERGMLEFQHAALLEVAKKHTSIEEVFRVIPAEYLLIDD